MTSPVYQPPEPSEAENCTVSFNYLLVDRHRGVTVTLQVSVLQNASTNADGRMVFTASENKIKTEEVWRKAEVNLDLAPDRSFQVRMHFVAGQL